jgi:hypothetical protein
MAGAQLLADQGLLRRTCVIAAWLVSVDGAGQIRMPLVHR